MSGEIAQFLDGVVPTIKPGATRSEKRIYAMELYGKGFSPADVVRKCNISHVTSVKYHKDFKQKYLDKSIEDPYILEKVVENVYKILDKYEDQEKEAWKVYNSAVETKDQTSALRLLKDITANRAQTLRLNDIKIEVVNRTQRALATQSVIMGILSDPNIMCPECRNKVMAKLGSLNGNGSLAIQGEINGEIDEVIEDGVVVNA